MNAEAFNDEEFQVHRWVNATLATAINNRGEDKTTPLSDTVSGLVRELQSLATSIAGKLDETSLTAVGNIPSALRGLDRVRREAKGLSPALESLQSTLEAVEEATSTSVSPIETLYELQTRVSNTAAALAGVDKVAGQFAEIDNDFESGDFDGLSIRLSALKASLKTLTGLPDAEMNMKSVIEYEERLSTLMVPVLEDAFARHHVEDTLKAIVILSRVGQGDRSTWMPVYRSRLSEVIESQWSKRSPNTTLTAWMPEFHSTITSLVSGEASFLQQLSAGLVNSADVGADASRELDVSQTLQRTLRAALSSSSYSTSYSRAMDSELHISPSLHTATKLLPPDLPNSPDNLIASPQGVLSALARPPPGRLIPVPPAIGAVLPGLAAVVTAALNGTSSILTCQEAFANPDVATVAELVAILLGPAKDHLGSGAYESLERGALWLALNKDVLAASALSGQSGAVDVFLDTVGKVSDSVPKLIGVLDAALSRMMAVSGGGSIVGLLGAVEAVLKEYVGRVLAAVHQLRLSAGLNQPVHTSTEADWSKLQGALQLLQVVSHGSNQLAAWSGRLSETISGLPPAMSLESTDVWNPEASLMGLLPSVLLDLAEDAQSARAQYESVRASPAGAVAGLLAPLGLLNSAVQRFVHDVMVAPMQGLLSSVPSASEWAEQPDSGPKWDNVKLPTFSLSPLGYITAVGEHLLALPVHLEPFAASASPPVALEGRLPGTSPGGPVGADGYSPDSFAPRWLGVAAGTAMVLYQEVIEKIPQLSPMGSAQLSADVGYVCNLMGNAMGVAPTPALGALPSLLNAPLEQYSGIAAGLGEPLASSLLVRKIGQARGAAPV